MLLQRISRVALFKAQLASQANNSVPDKVFVPSVVLLTLSGLGLSLFGLHRLDSSRKHEFYLTPK